MDVKILESLLRSSGPSSALPFGSCANLENGRGCCPGHGYAADELYFDEVNGREALCDLCAGFGYCGVGGGFLDEDICSAFESKASLPVEEASCNDWVYGFESKLAFGYGNGLYGADKKSVFGNPDRKEGIATGDDNGHACRCPSSLKGLTPVSIAEMKVGESYHGCVLLGTVCNQAEVVDGMLRMSIQEPLGTQVHVSMHFKQDDPSDALDLKKEYPVGQHIAIKHPCLRHTLVDKSSFILVWSPRETIKKVEKLAIFDPEMLLEEAQMYATEESWDNALHYLTKCIDMVGEQKDGFYKPKAMAKSEASRILVESLSTQAKVLNYTYCFEEALRACDQALKLDPHHCKSLYRKGLALEGLFRFEEACDWLERAANSNAGKGKTKRQRKINAILRSCRKCCSENQNGQYADLARYLLRTYKPKNGAEVPSFSNHVGSVKIRLLGGAKGRGMFASKNVKSGDVLLVSNAMAICYQREDVGQSTCIYDNEFDNLVSKVESMENLQHALSYMAGSGYMKNTSCTSEIITLADSFAMPSAAHDDTRVHIKKDNIKEIVKLNALGPHFFCSLLARHGYACKYVNERAYLRLWFLPSFINHSCVSNASRLVVGNTMLVHAACDIKAGEEIVLPYFDTLMPLKQRNEAMKRWKFRCQCKRCTFEQNLQTPLRNVAESFERVYQWIRETIVKSVAAKSLKGFGDKGFDVPTSQECQKMRTELGNVMLSIPKFSVNAEKDMWMMASYSSLLWFQLLAETNDVFSDPLVMGSLRLLVDSMQCVAPGHIRSLVVIGTMNVSNRSGLLEAPAMAICKSVFGAQEPHVLAELVRLYASVVPFP